MLYKYITENNLEYPQTYMYSQYYGIDFLRGYIETREEYLMNHKNTDGLDGMVLQRYADAKFQSETFARIWQIYLEILEKNDDKKFVRKEIEYYIKVFEIRKRLYNTYIENSYKPLESSGYSFYGNYLLFSLTMEELYFQDGNLKYLNSLLKVNDTLLSVSDCLDQTEEQIYVNVLEKELAHIKKLIADNHINLNEVSI